MRAGRIAILLALGLVAALLVPAGAQAAVGVVKGTVEPLAWAPEVEVCLVEGRSSETCTAPGPDGAYVLEVPLGEVQIEFVPSLRSGLLTQYYNHQSFLAEAAKIKLTREQPEAKGIDADLIEGATIAGTVSAAPSGLPLSEVEVCAISAGAAPIRRCEETDPSGAYEVHSLPGGTYKMSFRGRGESAGYQPSYYSGKQTLAQATPIQVTARTTKSGIDATLEQGAAIQGTLTEAGGPTLPAITVCLFEAGLSSAERCTYTDQAGTYAFAGLPSGSYEVGFFAQAGFEPLYYEGAATRAQAKTITATAPTTTSGIDGALVPTPPPPPPPPPPTIANPIFAAAAFVPEPAPPKRCKKGTHPKKVKGKTRCVKAKHKNKANTHKHKGTKR